jgi:hypothetical protein
MRFCRSNGGAANKSPDPDHGANIHFDRWPRKIYWRNIMDMQTLTSFFMWCTIINAGLMFVWMGIWMAAPDLVYRLQNFFFPIPRETFTVVFYSFLGLFKIFVIVFNAVPYVALLIIG